MSGRAERRSHFNPPSPCGEGPRQISTNSPRTYFNPPSPCGEGHSAHRHCVRYLHFNPPSPCGEGQIYLSAVYHGGLFQSTLPVWGGTAKAHKNSL